MPLNLKPMRFAHSEGHTDVCFDDKGRYLITGGSDGDVRVFDGFDDDDPQSFRAAETVAAVRFKDDRIITAAYNTVQIYKFPGGLPDGIITRFAGSVNHISYSLSGKFLAAGASDFNVKVANVSDCSHKSLKGHEAPVLSVSFDPDEQYVASSSCDGTVKFWDWKEQKCLKSLSLLQKSNDISSSKPLCRLAFQPCGEQYLAVPVNNDVKIYEKATWNNLFNLKEEDRDSQVISIVQWSPCGRYLATASMDGRIVIWCIKSRRVIERTKHEKSLTISCLVWNPKMNGEIAYTDNQGDLGICTNFIPKNTKAIAATKKKPRIIDNSEFNLHDLPMEDDLDVASETGSLSGPKKRKRVKNTWFDEEAEEDEMVTHDNDDDDDENTTDLGKIKAELAGPMGLVDEESNAATEEEITSAKSTITPVVLQQPQIVQQQPFQPGSTPTHLMHRFMVWNYVGIVRCHAEQEPSSIDIEFHDASLHHSMHVVNYMNYTMAALSDSAVLLACQANEELPSKMLCLHFGTWDRSKEWSVSMPQGEDIMAVAVGSTWTAVATNQNWLRIFSIGGVQTEIVCLPGPVVSMSGLHNQLIVVYHSGVGAPGCQCMSAKLIDLRANTHIIDGQQLPLSPRANLSWLGFSVEGTPVMVDSVGVVRLLNRSFGNTWTPVANTKTQVKRSSDNYWVVGLVESSEQIRCVLCTGSTYPPTLPRPILCTLPLQLPVCEITTDKGQLEENYLRSRLLGNRFEYQKQRGMPVEEELYERTQTEIKQLLIKLFALSCKTDRDFRAKEICELLPDAYSVSLAIKYASRSRHMNLAQRLDELARRKAEEEAAAEEEEEIYPVEHEYQPRDEHDVHIQRNSSVRNKRERLDVRTPESSAPAGRSERKREDRTVRDVREACNEQEDEYDVEGDEIENGDKEEPPTETLNGPRLSKSVPSSRTLLSRPKPNCQSIGTLLSQDTTRRFNPFKVSDDANKETHAARSKGFFDSVEKEKSVLAKKAKNNSSPAEETKKINRGKQLTLFGKRKTDEGKLNEGKKTKEVEKKDKEKTVNEDDKQDRATKKTASNLKQKAFKYWLEVITPVIREDNPMSSEEEVVKVAMKQWREMPEEELQVWIKNATKEVTNKKEMVETVEENLEKKRKRDEESNDNEIRTSVEELVEEKENISKKIKSFDKREVNSKLAGFAFSKS